MDIVGYTSRPSTEAWLFSILVAEGRDRARLERDRHG